MRMSFRKLMPNYFHKRFLHKFITPLDPSFQLRRPSFVATNLIKYYFQQGLINQARGLFDEMFDRDVVVWTAMISGYSSCNHYKDGWMAFCDMLRESEDNPNAFTLSSALKVCKGMKLLSCGALVHSLALKYGLDGSPYVENALLDMYATCCCSMDEACAVFRGMVMKIPVSWTILITGYTHRGDGYGALQAFTQMLTEKAETNPFSFSIAVKACTLIGSYTYGKQIHAAVVKHGFNSNVIVMNSILDMYCRCSYFCEAHQCFDGMEQKDLFTWNTLIAGYELSHPVESLFIFSRMELEGFSPDSFTYSSVISACANLAVLGCGQQVHGGIFRRGLEGDIALANALIDMYAKCGSMMDSCRMFSQMSNRDLVSWTSMMIGYGSHGCGKEAIELFDKMVSSGKRPDRIVLLAVLGACSHAGMVDEGLSYFKSMIADYNITLDQEIYGCVIDLLGRGGRVVEAFELIESMPFNPDESVWGALLGACKVHGLPDLNKWASQSLSELKPSKPGSYVTLSSIYAAQGKWIDFARIRKLMRGTGNKKEVGTSWVEVRNQVYSFVVADMISPHCVCACEVIDIFFQHMQESENVPDVNFLMHDSKTWSF